MAASWKARPVRSGDYVASTERGQLAHSIRYMAKAWKWTPAKTQRYLKRLEKLKMICVETDTGVSVVTICKYDEYQNGGKATDTGPIQDRYRTDTEKKKDERREEGKKKDAYASSAQSGLSQHFEDFWQAYPHRNGKKDPEGRRQEGLRQGDQRRSNNSGNRGRRRSHPQRSRRLAGIWARPSALAQSARMDGRDPRNITSTHSNYWRPKWVRKSQSRTELHPC